MVVQAQDGIILVIINIYVMVLLEQASASMVHDKRREVSPLINIKKYNNHNHNRIKNDY